MDKSIPYPAKRIIDQAVHKHVGITYYLASKSAQQNIDT